MITCDTWLAVFRGSLGDVIYVDGKERLRLVGDFVLPNPLIRYRGPFARAGRYRCSF